MSHLGRPPTNGTAAATEATTATETSTAGGVAPAPTPTELTKRRDELAQRVAEMQWDLGGLFYEMAIRDQIRLPVLVERAARMQEADAELGEIERMIHNDHTGSAGNCTKCGALYSRGAGYCWRCGQAIVEQVHSAAVTDR